MVSTILFSLRAWSTNFLLLPVWRPADGNETSGAYFSAMETIRTPSILWFVSDCSHILRIYINILHLSLTRQNLPQLAGSSIEKTLKGGYVVVDTDKPADLTFVSSGSEVSISIEAAELLTKKGLSVRVVSFPCWEVFEQQSREYRLSVLPDGAPIISVEAYSVSHLSHNSSTLNRTHLTTLRPWAGLNTLMSKSD